MANIIKLQSPHTLDESNTRCSECLAVLDRWEQEGPCKPIVWYIRHDQVGSEIYARSPQLKLEVNSHSTRHLQPVIIKAMNDYFNRLGDELLVALKSAGLALPIDLDPADVPSDATWDVPYQTKRQQ